MMSNSTIEWNMGYCFGCNDAINFWQTGVDQEVNGREVSFHTKCYRSFNLGLALGSDRPNELAKKTERK